MDYMQSNTTKHLTVQRPTCNCGCGVVTSYKRGKYKRFISGHNARQNRLSIDDIKRRLNDVHGNVVTLKVETYQNINKHAIFVDVEFGEWFAKPFNVLNGRSHPKRKLQKSRITSLKRYGFISPVQSPDVQDRIMKSSHNVTWINHWKTGKSLPCKASYEVAFVNWCNLNQIDFDWQIHHKMPDGHIYIIDAFIKDGTYVNTWIEIKGYMRSDAQRKWTWFQSVYSNTQLWDKTKLREIGVML